MIMVKSIIRRMHQGATGPYLCMGEDNKLYVVKGPNTTYKGLINEWICAHLGQEIHLPIPAFSTAYIDRTLIEYGDYDLDEGEWFASEYQHNIQDVTYNILGHFGHENLKLLFVFDYWIQNGDRNLTDIGGNPNLFVSPLDKRFFVLDHNLAFDKNFDACFAKNKSIHLGASSWYAAQLELYETNNYKMTLNAALSKIDNILNSVPQEWVEKSEDSSILANIKLILSRINSAEFWEGIK